MSNEYINYNYFKNYSINKISSSDIFFLMSKPDRIDHFLQVNASLKFVFLRKSRKQREFSVLKM